MLNQSHVSKMQFEAQKDNSVHQWMWLYTALLRLTLVSISGYKHAIDTSRGFNVENVVKGGKNWVSMGATIQVVLAHQLINPKDKILQREGKCPPS